MRSSSLLSESICRLLVISLFALDRFQVSLCVFNCALLCRCAVCFLPNARENVSLCSATLEMGGCLGVPSRPLSFCGVQQTTGRVQTGATKNRTGLFLFVLGFTRTAENSGVNAPSWQSAVSAMSYQRSGFGTVTGTVHLRVTRSNSEL